VSLVAALLTAAHGVPKRELNDRPLNLILEEGELGQIPEGWQVHKDVLASGYVIELTDVYPKEGRRCATIHHSGSPPGRMFGNLMQACDANAYRGKIVRFRAAVRPLLEGYRDRAQLWLRIDRAGGQIGFFDNMHDRPIRESGWHYYEIVGGVAADAEAINFGVMLLGEGTVFLDDVSLEVVGDVGIGDESSHPLEGRALENLVAFTRLLGYVRYFHPSDEAAATNWDEFAIAAVREVERAADAVELAEILEQLFHPIAPAVRVLPTSMLPDTPSELAPPKGQIKPRVVTWEHHGAGTGAAHSIYRSARIGLDDEKPQEGFGNLMQWFDATPYRGRTIRFCAAVRTEVTGIDNAAQLWLRVDRPNGQMGFFDNMGDRPIKDDEWREYEIVGEVADDATGICLGVFLRGEGRAWIDDATLTAVSIVDGDDLASPGSGIANAGMEQGQAGQAPPGWLFADTRSPAICHAALTENRPHSGRLCTVLAGGAHVAEALPEPRQPFRADLSGGVSCIVPMSLYVDEQGTLPRATAQPFFSAPPRADGFLPTGNDRATRLAAVALAWNVLQHFYPYFDVVSTDWQSVLVITLKEAAVHASEEEFLATLERMLAALDDGHAGVTAPGAPAAARLQLLWEWVENQLVVTRVAEEIAGQVSVGDIILAIDGRPVAEILRAEEELVSGATPQWRRCRALARLTLGPVGENVKLTIQRPPAPAFTVSLVRELKSGDNQKPLEPLEESRPPKVDEIRPGVFYLDLGRISDEDFEAALPDLATARGIIFDLRGNPTLSVGPISHLIEEPVTCAQWHVPVVTRPDRQEMRFDFSNWPVPPRSPHLGAKVAFLADGRAISYAETYLGIVEHYQLAEIIGGPTAGTNGNVNSIRLPGGYSIRFTGMKVLKHDGSQHHGIGIQPTLRVERTIDGVIAGRDEVLERAIDVVSG
jgi:C-terminal processing protease CtpA/Prc